MHYDYQWYGHLLDGYRVDISKYIRPPSQ